MLTNENNNKNNGNFILSRISKKKFFLTLKKIKHNNLNCTILHNLHSLQIILIIPQ